MIYFSAFRKFQCILLKLVASHAFDVICHQSNGLYAIIISLHTTLTHLHTHTHHNQQTDHCLIACRCEQLCGIMVSFSDVTHALLWYRSWTRRPTSTASMTTWSCCMKTFQGKSEEPRWFCSWLVILTTWRSCFRTVPIRIHHTNSLRNDLAQWKPLRTEGEGERETIAEFKEAGSRI